MARRRRRRYVRRAKTRTRRVYMKAKRRRRRSSGSNPTKLFLAAGLYGAGRQTVVNFIQPLTSKVPFGQYADEVVLGVAGWYLAKKGRGMLKDVGRAMLTIEAASFGSGLIGGAVGGNGNGGWQ